MEKTSQSGVALLMSLGMLALLSVLGAAFAINMRLLERTTRDFIYEVQARYLAEGGLEYAIAQLKSDARSNFIFNGINPSGTNKDERILTGSDYSSLGDNKIRITAIDTARQININNANKKLLKCIDGIGTGLATDIYDKRGLMPEQKFLTKKSVCLSSGSGIPYDKIKDFITVNTYSDPNIQGKNEDSDPQSRSALNINSLARAIGVPIDTSKSEYILLRDILKSVEDVGDATASTIITALINNPDKPIKSWQEFNGLINSLGITDDAKKKVKEMFNPNRAKPHGLSDETKGIPTEFCFHSGGNYEIAATGTITKGTGTQQQQVASRTITAAVNIFDLWNMTTRLQFKNTTSNYDRVTWFDSCPLNITKCYTGYSPSGTIEKIPGSLKLGYWDDFSEDVDYSKSVWKKINGDYTIDGVLTGTQPTEPQNSPLAGLGRFDDTNKKWRWEYFSIRAQLSDNGEPTQKDNHYTWSCGWIGYFDVSAHLFVDSKTDELGGTKQYDIFISRTDPKETCPEKDNPKHENTWPEIYYLRFWYKVFGNIYSQETKEITKYHKDKTFEVVRTGIFEQDDTVKVTAHYLDSSDSLSKSGLIIPHWTPNYVGLIRVFGANLGFTLDNIRVIGMCRIKGDNIEFQLPTAGEYGYYDFSPTGFPSGYEWGTAFATVTIPTTANGDSEKVSIYIRNTGGEKWALIGTSSDTGPGPGGSSVTGPINITDSTNAECRVELTTLDDDYSETPVLEDIWITYLPRTRILYWREGG